jgi:hypothetical protein
MEFHIINTIVKLNTSFKLISVPVNKKMAGRIAL